MATVPSPRTWVAGEILTAANLNANVRDAVNYLIAPPRAKAYRSAALSVTNDTDAIIALDAEDHDTDTLHSNVTANSKMIAVTAGRYRAWGQVAFANNATGYRTCQLLKNGVVQAQTRILAASGTVASLVQCYDEILLSVGDYIELQCRQTSGGSLALGVGAANATFLGVAWASTT